MPLLRRLLLLAIAAAAFGVVSSPALAASARDNSLPFQLDSVNFRVHYQSDHDSQWGITQTQAGDIAAYAERALAKYLADGYPRPASDGILGGDGRIDIYVEDYSLNDGLLGVTEWDADNVTTSAFIGLAGNVPDESLTLHTVAHEVFHAIQLAMWLPTRVSDFWLLEGSAEWAGFRTDGYPAAEDVGPPDMALDCRDPLGTNKCDMLNNYDNNGYSRWPFFEYLSETYGASFLKDVFAQGAAGYPNTTATQALAQALVAKGTTLSDAYNNWISVDMRSAYTAVGLQGLVPQVYGSFETGVEAKTVIDTKVPVNHLSTRYLEILRGQFDGGKDTCYEGTLTVNVDIPSGVTSKPIFWWDEKGNAPVFLSVNGGTASTTVPWDTCTWTGTEAYLALPNSSLTTDAGDMHVTATLAIDINKPTTAIAPPTPAKVNTPVVQASNGDIAPTVSVFGPELLKLAAGDTEIRLLIESNASGLLQAKLGATTLGSVKIRGGNNDVRFKLPAGAVASLRSSAATGGVLTLTPLASSSSTPGTAVTQKVRLAPAKVAAKPKPKLKKPKAKAKKSVKTAKPKLRR